MNPNKSLCKIAPFFLISFFLLFNPTISKANKCNFYKETNRKHTCPSKKNYLKNYGYKFCRHFTELEESKGVSIKLTQWILNTRSCLQEMLLESENRHKWDCATLKEFAFDIHPACYKVFGFCSLPDDDLVKVLKVILKNGLITMWLKEKRVVSMQFSNIALHCTSTKGLLDNVISFYTIIIENKFSNSSKAAKQSIEIIEKSPDSLRKMNEYFGEVISSIFSSSFALNKSAAKASVYGKKENSIALNKSAAKASVYGKKENSIKILSKNISMKDLKRGLKTARALAAKRKKH